MNKDDPNEHCDTRLLPWNTMARLHNLLIIAIIKHTHTHRAFNAPTTIKENNTGCDASVGNVNYRGMLSSLQRSFVSNWVGQCEFSTLPVCPHEWATSLQATHWKRLTKKNKKINEKVYKAPRNFRRQARVMWHNIIAPHAFHAFTMRVQSQLI